MTEIPRIVVPDFPLPLGDEQVVTNPDLPVRKRPN